MKQNNIELSNLLNSRIPATVKQVIAKHFYENETSKAKHNREVLEDILTELNTFRDSIPSISEMKACNLL